MRQGQVRPPLCALGPRLIKDWIGLLAGVRTRAARFHEATRALAALTGSDDSEAVEIARSKTPIAWTDFQESIEDVDPANVGLERSPAGTTKTHLHVLVRAIDNSQENLARAWTKGMAPTRRRSACSRIAPSIRTTAADEGAR